MSLANQKCVPCEGGVDPISGDKAQQLLAQLHTDWKIVEDGKKLQRTFVFKDFHQSMAFLNTVADIAETEGHHPDIAVFYNKVTLTLWTHAINGLFDNDFILAAKIDQIKQ